MNVWPNQTRISEAFTRSTGDRSVRGRGRCQPKPLRTLPCARFLPIIPVLIRSRFSQRPHRLIVSLKLACIFAVVCSTDRGCSRSKGGSSAEEPYGSWPWGIERTLTLGPLEQGSPTDLGLLRRCGTTKSWPSQLGGAGDDEERRQEEIGAAPGGGDWVERRQEEIGRSSDGPAVVLPAPVTVGARGLPRPPRDFFFLELSPIAGSRKCSIRSGSSGRCSST
jgi:hypothetical protein